MRYLKFGVFLKFVVTALVLPFLTACGDESAANDPTISIAISPTSQNVEIGESVELTVTARNTAIVWPTPGTIEGSFTVNGNMVSYVPPSVIGTYRFTVAAEADPSRTVTARITVVYAAPEITITPATASVNVGKTVQFAATVTIPTGQPQNQVPDWRVTGLCGNIDQNGLFSAATAGICTVTASIMDNNNRRITESATVTIANPTLDDIMRDMVQVTGGTFTMGCSGSGCPHNALSPVSVTLSDFHIGKYPVTQFIWKQIMGVNMNPSQNLGDNLPVENASWDEIQTFIERLNERTGRSYRLPTEAEWEYAARGGNQSRGYMYSGSNVIDDVGWYIDNSDGRTHPIGMKQDNELGINDMSGNVDEWVSDRVVRGGSAIRDAAAASVYSRGGCTGICNPNPYLGFRLAITSR